MLLPSDTDLAVAVDSSTRHPLWSLLADWSGDGSYSHPYSDISQWVQSIETERAATTDLPEAVSLVSGMSAATIDIVLKQPAFDLLNVWDTTGSLYGRPLVTIDVRLDLGFHTAAGPRLMRQFTGHLRHLRSEAGEKLVKLVAVDPSEKLRAPITLPDYGMFLSDDAIYHQPWTVNSQWVIDYILRRNGIYASPPPRNDAVISCTGHGGLVAELGFNRSPRGLGPFGEDPWVDGAWSGTLAVPGNWQIGNYQEFFAANEFQVVPGVGIGASGWVYFGTGMTEPDVTPASTQFWIQLLPDLDHGRHFNIRLGADGKIYPDIDISGTFYTPTPKPCGVVGWRYVGVHWKYNVAGDWTVTIRSDGTTTSQTISAGAWSGKWEPAMQSTIWMPRPWSNYQVWLSPTAPVTWPGETHVSQADLDRGRGAVSHLPTVVNEDSLALIAKIVSAEFALFGFDETGRAFFRAQQLGGDTNSIDRTVATSRAIKDLSSGVSSDGVVNSVGWHAEPMFYADSEPQAVVKSASVHEFDVTSGTSQFLLPVPPGYAVPPQTIPRIASVDWVARDANDSISAGYAAIYLTGTEVPNDGSLSVKFSQVSETHGLLTIVNTSNTPVQFQTLDPGGQPAMRVYGLPLRSDGLVHKGVEANTGSADVYGDRTFPLESSEWRTDPESAQRLAAALAAQLGSPIPVVDDIPLVGDPRLQIGDLVRIQAADQDFRVRLVKISHSLSESDGLTTTVAARPIAPPGLGVWDDTTLGVWDDTLIWGP